MSQIYKANIISSYKINATYPPLSHQKFKKILPIIPKIMIFAILKTLLISRQKDTQ
ncbi:hypothetical protein HCCG_00712 [Helicobacter cinaedi CCUG 18818 = ATCC BAA-847]|uniref:Uncharacterized protein n=1 Tax=Helicobacter cinaedi CCUG 18818 = ATCC BAA-847 TaxID=537971 RepID=A0ABN0B9K6_9HELI|nr:hypothetical protein HCCG_00712 [Helicobacter cinaedi CCUG 18818 = ATCC BAA-847]BBB21122.1 hypothetical protein HC081234_22990 [Helicobacter cinaedi]